MSIPSATRSLARPRRSAGYEAGEELPFRLVRPISRISWHILIDSALIAALLWLILVSTLLGTPVVGGQMWLVQRNAYPALIPAGQVVSVHDTPESDQPLDRIIDGWNGTPGTSIHQVLAMPTQVVTATADGQLVVNDADSGFRVPLDVAETLAATPLELGQGDYLTVCLAGDCAGEDPTVTQRALVGGRVLARFDLGGVAPVPTYLNATTVEAAR